MFDLKFPKSGPIAPHLLKQHFIAVFLLHNAFLFIAFFAPQLPTLLLWMWLRIFLLQPVNDSLAWYPNKDISAMCIEIQRLFSNCCENRIIGEFAITSVYLMGHHLPALYMLVLLNFWGLVTTYRVLRKYAV